MKTWRMDVNPDRLVTRHFRLDDPEDLHLRVAMMAVDDLPGVQDVTWQPEENTLNVLYDAGVEQLGQVRQTLEDIGMTVHEDFHSVLSETLWRFEDALMRASSTGGARHTV